MFGGSDNNGRKPATWQHIHRGRARMLPVLGKFRPVGAPSWPDNSQLTARERRDTFTKTVCYPALPRAPEVADVDFLRQLGHSLPTEAEVLHSQRLRLKVSYSKFLESIYASQERMSSYSRRSTFTQLRDSLTAGAKKQSNLVKVVEHWRQLAARKRLEQRIHAIRMKSLQESMRHKLNSAQLTPREVRKMTLPALDHENLEWIAENKQDLLPKINPASRQAAPSAMLLDVFQMLDEQGQKDVDMAAKYRLSVKVPKHVRLSQTEIGPRVSSSSADNSDVNSVSWLK